MKAILETKNLVKYYGTGENLVKAIDHTDIRIEPGEFVAVRDRGRARFFTCWEVWTARTPGRC